MIEEYWAACPVEKLGDEMRERIDSYRRVADTEGRRELWRRAYRAYFGYDEDGTFKRSHMVRFDGSEGELAKLKQNIYRPLVRRMSVMISGSRPSFVLRPNAYDARATELATLGRGILDHYLDAGVEADIQDAVINALIAGEGWVGVLWDEQAGRELYDDPAHGIVYEGDVSTVSLRPDQVVRDTSRDTMRDHDWLIIARRVSRWTLAALCPQHRESILAARDERLGDYLYANGMSTYDMRGSGNLRGGDMSGQTDTVLVYELFHRKTAALPMGRYAMLCDDTIIRDGANTYGIIPVFGMICSREPGRPAGYADSWDILGIQSAVDTVMTQVVTAKENFGLQTFYQQGTEAPDVLNIGSMRVISGSAPLVGIDHSRGAVDEGTKAANYLLTAAQMITGISDAAMGNAGSDASGKRVIAEHNMAVAFNGAAQASLAQLYQDSMNCVLRNLRNFATTERVVHIVGANKQGLAKRFKSDDLSAIDQVAVEIMNATMRTTTQRQATADKLLAAGVIRTPEQYLAVSATGQLAAILEGPEGQESLIERENERLQNGTPVKTLATDHHETHIARHLTLLNDPDIRWNDPVVAMISAHVMEHINMWNGMSTSPEGVVALAATGQQPSPALAAAMQQAPTPAPAPSAAPTAADVDDDDDDDESEQPDVPSGTTPIDDVPTDANAEEEPIS